MYQLGSRHHQAFIGVPLMFHYSLRRGQHCPSRRVICQHCPELSEVLRQIITLSALNHVLTSDYCMNPGCNNNATINLHCPFRSINRSFLGTFTEKGNKVPIPIISSTVSSAFTLSCQAGGDGRQGVPRHPEMRQ